MNKQWDPFTVFVELIVTAKFSFTSRLQVVHKVLSKTIRTLACNPLPSNGQPQHSLKPTSFTSHSSDINYSIVYLRNKNVSTALMTHT